MNGSKCFVKVCEQESEHCPTPTLQNYKMEEHIKT